MHNLLVGHRQVEVEGVLESYLNEVLDQNIFRKILTKFDLTKYFCLIAQKMRVFCCSQLSKQQLCNILKPIFCSLVQKNIYINSLMKIQPTTSKILSLPPPGLNFIDPTRQLNGKLATWKSTPFVYLMWKADHPLSQNSYIFVDADDMDNVFCVEKDPTPERKKKVYQGECIKSKPDVSVWRSLKSKDLIYAIRELCTKELVKVGILKAKELLCESYKICPKSRDKKVIRL